MKGNMPTTRQDPIDMAENDSKEIIILSEDNYQLNLNKDGIMAIWAALLAMCLDIHCGHDNMSETEWNAAECLFENFNKVVDS